MGADGIWDLGFEGVERKREGVWEFGRGGGERDVEYTVRREGRQESSLFIPHHLAIVSPATSTPFTTHHHPRSLPCPPYSHPTPPRPLADP
jgi:hypothetical protein